MTIVRATARLQFHRDFPMDRGTELIPYFKKLGISHIYASPLLKARPGSTHGYDIVDHNQINPELGGEDALRRMVETLRHHGMGLILDIVPNHMGVGGSDNSWWLDVLEWGRASPYAEYFDIDWEPPDSTLRNRLLAPFLGASYGEALANGDIMLRFDEADGRFFASVYGEHRFPIAVRDYTAILRAGGMTQLAERFAEAGPGGRDAIRRRAEVNRVALVEAQPGNAAAFKSALDAYDPKTPEGHERLHRLLERQSYRLAWWRAAADEINWRRFFDINGLAGVRVERPEVFDDTHATILRLYAEGLIDGVRVDHVDGLADPRGYCRKLRRKLEHAHGQRPPELRDTPAILWVEKILFAHERLPADWLTDGTTGYDFMNEVSAVLHDPAGEEKLTTLWSTLTGRVASFQGEAEPARRQILRQALSSELNAAAAALHRVARRDLRTRDFSLTAFRRALEELLTHFRTYRIYAGPAGASDTDRRDFAWALAGARRTVRTADAGLLDIVGGMLLGDGVRDTAVGAPRQERLRAMVRFQQLSAPTAAKSVEDTAFYRYGRLLSRNEVGSEPSQFALPVANFHASARDRLKRLPRALLATATHDHKRGEDTRVRLAVLGELPDEWEAALQRWTRLNATVKREVDNALAPDVADEVMLYQMIVAAWPLGLAADDAEGLAAYRERLAAWQEKALREAKRHSEWAAPNVDYESACRDFLAQCIDPTRSAPLARELHDFANRIAVAGVVNSLTQTLLRLTMPGVPDLYQGTEFWDFSLVDPDNRQPVDYDARTVSLEAADAPAALLGNWVDGRVKQALIARVLNLRARVTGLFAQGAYVTLKVEGDRADSVIAFARIHEGRAVIVAGTRLAAQILGGATHPLVPSADWSATAIILPRNLVNRRWVNVLGSSADEAAGVVEAGGRMLVRDLFARLPVALLEAL